MGPSTPFPTNFSWSHSLHLRARPKINVVWLKRDLRVRDHAPLHAAVTAGLPYVLPLLHDQYPEPLVDYDHAFKENQSRY